MDKNIVPEDFNLALVFVDAIPVLFFALSTILIAARLKNFLFTAGAVLCFSAGFFKVLWKLIVVLHKKNVWLLFVQLRFLMPLGFLLMIFSIVGASFRSQIVWQAVAKKIFLFPQIIFFALGILGMILMGVFAFTLDGKNLKSNWIEQITNGISQICIFLGILFCT